MSSEHNEWVQQLKELVSSIPTTRYDYSGKPIFDPNRRKIRMPRFKPGALEERLYRAHPEIALIQRRLWNIWESAIVWRHDVGISEALPQYYHLDDIAYAFDVVIARDFDPNFLLPDFQRLVCWEDLKGKFRSGASNGRYEARMGLAYIARIRRYVERLEAHHRVFDRFRRRPEHIARLEAEYLITKGRAGHE